MNPYAAESAEVHGASGIGNTDVTDGPTLFLCIQRVVISMEANSTSEVVTLSYVECHRRFEGKKQYLDQSKGGRQ
jgi:hypothetical protein